MKQVLITGAGGYIGSNAVEYFMKQGCRVTGMVRERVAERFRASGAEAVRAELTDFTSLDRLFEAKRYDCVIHAAARASDVGRDALFRAANFDAVKHLASLSMKHGVGRFVYLSTSDVYGLRDFHGETEDELAFDRSPRNPYPKYKIQSEIWLAGNLPPERFSCVRPCVVRGNGDTTITPRAVAYLKSSPWVFHFGKWRGLNRWPLAHVENVCRTLFAAMTLPEAGGQGVTVLDSEFTTVSRFYRELAAEYLPGKPIREVCLPVWPVLPAAWLSSGLSTLSGRYAPFFDPTLYALETITHNLDFSNNRMLEWFKKQGNPNLPERKWKMLDKVIVLIVLAVTPVLLWYIPQTRRMTGSFMTALKTVPFGCLTMIFIPFMIYETIMVLGRFFAVPLHISPFWRIGFAVFGMGIGILLIWGVARWSWRKYQAEGKRSWIPFVLLFSALAGGTVIFIATSTMIRFAHSPQDYRGAWQSIQVLEDDKAPLAFEQASIHPFLAEYDYRLRFGGGDKAEYRKLRLNTGGRTYFNLYRLRDGRLFMQDKDSDYIVDPAKREVWFVFSSEGKKYMAPYPNQENAYISWGAMNGEVIFQGGDGEFKAVPLTDELDGKEYFGCIEQQFYPAREKSEQPIGKKQ